MGGIFSTAEAMGERVPGGGWGAESTWSGWQSCLTRAAARGFAGGIGKVPKCQRIAKMRWVWVGSSKPGRSDCYRRLGLVLCFARYVPARRVPELLLAVDQLLRPWLGQSLGGVPVVFVVLPVRFRVIATRVRLVDLCRRSTGGFGRVRVVSASRKTDIRRQVWAVATRKNCVSASVDLISANQYYKDSSRGVIANT